MKFSELRLFITLADSHGNSRLLEDFANGLTEPQYRSALIFEGDTRPR